MLFNDNVKMDCLTEKQKLSLDYFQSHLEQWCADPLYKLKYVVVYDRKIAGLFDTFDAALADAVSKFPRTEFIIQQIISDKEIINFLYPAVA